MITKLHLAFLFILATPAAFANNYFTPGTGVKWNLNDLVANSGGDVTFVGGEYFVNDTIFISQNDTLYITTNAVVKYAAGTYMDVNGTLLVDPPVQVLFTAVNTASGFLGMRIDSSNSTIIRKLTFEYANSLRLFDSHIKIDSCIFQNNSPLTSFGNAAISVFRSNPVITNTQFLNNQRAAIQGGANIANAPQISNCLFMGNNTLNGNVPQINLGTSGSDTVRILNCQLLRSSTNSGGIGFLPIGNVYAIISGNVIKNNRYGMTFNGGSNINTIISYNQVDSNNTGANPATGGSGIAFSGGSTTSHQNSIVTGNLFRWNLWGVTIQNGSKPNLGDLTNSDTTDDGKNWFVNNTNTSTPNIDLYNNSPDSIFAQGNNWNTNVLSEIEDRIFHKPDNSALGPVNYTNYIVLPIQISSFVAVADGRSVLLKWQTISENNSDHFSIEKSEDGKTFKGIGIVYSAGNSNDARTYSFTDDDINGGSTKFYYRLKLVDKDARFKYSNTLLVSLKNVNENSVKLYPTIINGTQPLQAEVYSDKPQLLTIQFINATGKIVYQTSKALMVGNNSFIINNKTDLLDGILYVHFVGKGIDKTIRVLKIQ